MAVRSTQVVIGPKTVGGGGSVDLYTVDPDRTLIIKDVRAFHLAGASAGILAVVGAGGEIGHVVDTLAAAGSLTIHEPWVVALENQTLRFFGAVGDQHRWLISGALLSGDPT